ncbi:MAG: ASCH domain-containing protein [Acidimicrobiales bacterium]
MTATDIPPASPWALVQGQPAVLSVRQPWAWALVNGHKDVENRTWRTTQRGLVAIHAGRRADPAGYRSCERMGLDVPPDLPLGALVGAVELVDIVEHHPSPWASPDGFNWVLGRAFPISPIPMVGRLGIFGTAPAVAPVLLEAVGER